MINLYAVWTPAVTVITFDFDGVSGSTGSASVNYGEPLASGLSAPTRYGYTFKGYYNAVGGSGTQYYSADMISQIAAWDSVAEGITLYSCWEGVDYAIQYVNDEEQLGTTIPAKYGVSFNLVQTATSESESVFTYAVANMSSDQYVKVSGLAIRTFSIGYVLNGGAMTTTDFATGFAAGETKILPTAAEISRTGFTFDGWLAGLPVINRTVVEDAEKLPKEIILEKSIVLGQDTVQLC